jgi:DNA polymerase-3 subunit alpha
MNTSNLKENIGKTIVVEGLYVTLKYVKTVKGEIMNFGTWVDSDGNYFDSVHFPDSLKMSPFRGHGVYILKGKVVEEFGYPSIEVSSMEKCGLRKDPRSDE